MDIKHDNILYIRDFSEIGGVETFIWEMVKKYKDRDIAVVYKNAHPNQLKRVRQYCRAYQHTNQKINCKVAIINYDISIIDYITPDIWKENAKKDEGIIQVIHGDYENPAYPCKPPTDDRIKLYVGVTKYICESFKRITGLENVTFGYNPLTIEEDEPCLKLISATRLSKIKGKDRMIKLANALDNAGISYIWYVFTNEKDTINNPNIIFMKSRLDVSRWLKDSDYLIQLSDTEACSYAINEALYRNIPVIVTPLPYLKEIGVKDGINSYIMNFDCNNMDHIVQNIRNIPKFNFKHLEDKYAEILAKGKSRYEEEKNMNVRVRALKKFEGIRDIERDVRPKAGDEWETSFERAEYLLQNGVIEIIGEIRDEKPTENVSRETIEEVKEELKKEAKKLTRGRKKIDTEK